MESENTSPFGSRTVPLICTAPEICGNDTFKVKDDRESEVLKLICVDCGHEQTWKLEEKQ
jgi:hypothetical protein